MKTKKNTPSLLLATFLHFPMHIFTISEDETGHYHLSVSVMRGDMKSVEKKYLFDSLVVLALLFNKEELRQRSLAVMNTGTPVFMVKILYVQAC